MSEKQKKNIFQEKVVIYNILHQRIVCILVSVGTFLF